MLDAHTQGSPRLVADALRLARKMGFDISCSPSTGRLLSVLAAQIHDGVVGEIGTGVGVGAAWMLSVLPACVQLVTVEMDRERAEAAQRLLAAYSNARVIHGDWHEMLQQGPFRLLFVDIRAAKDHESDLVIESLAPRGLAVVDDLTPGGLRAQAGTEPVDPVRKFWLTDTRLVASEIVVSPDEAVIVAARLAVSASRASCARHP